MNFTLEPSPQHCAFVKILSTLRFQDDINCVTKYEICERWEHDLPPEMRFHLQCRIMGKIRRLQLERSERKKILDFIKPMIDELLYWMIQHHWVPPSILQKLNICWTSVGRVDYKKTAEALISYEELGISKRYFLACTYCLESDIPKLWDKIPKVKKDYLIKQCAKYQQNFEPLIHWTLYMMEVSSGYRITPACISWQTAFESGLNKETTEYALQNLTPAEREQSLLKTTKKVAETCSENNSKILFFLLTQISEVEQMEIIQTYPYNSLKSLLHWSNQPLFLKTAARLCEFLSYENYLKITMDIIDEGSANNELFREFWKQSPMTHKKFIFYNGDSLMYKLFLNRDEYNINWIVKDATTPEDKNIFERCRFMFSIANSQDMTLIKFMSKFPNRPEIHEDPNELRYSDILSNRLKILRFPQILPNRLESHRDPNKLEFRKFFKK